MDWEKLGETKNQMWVLIHKKKSDVKQNKEN